MSNIILAIVGLPGSGKTEVTQYLQKKWNWPKIYFGKPVFDEMAKRGLTINEANEKIVREELRQTHGMAAMATLNIPEIKNLFTQSSVIIESLYSWEEYLTIKKEFGNNFYVLAVFASPETRIKRMANRPERPLTRAEVESRDYAQIDKLHQAGPIARADYMIINESDLAHVYQETDKFIDSITK